MANLRADPGNRRPPPLGGSRPGRRRDEPRPPLDLRTDLREGLAARPLHLPDGVVESTDPSGKVWRTAVEVEISRKTEARMAGILRQLLVRYDDVVYHAVPDAGAVVVRAKASVDGALQRVHVRGYPPAALAALA